jgi:predicted transcriptional regulator
MELPIDLQKLEPVRGAFDLLRYLSDKPNGVLDEDIMDDLDMSVRRFDKAKRRLVTTGYMSMRSDQVFELTQKGLDAAEVIAAYDRAQSDMADDADDKLQRQVVITVPRNLIIGEISPLRVGIEPSPDFGDVTDLVVRLEAIYADLGEWNEIVKLGTDALILETTITPQDYNQARLRLDVKQLSNDGMGISDCGGMYVDIAVLDSGDTGATIAYAAELEFDEA